MDIFRTLMRTRRAPLSPEHIGEIEFAKDPSVMAAWTALFSHFGTEHARRANERTDGITDQQERTNRDNTFGVRLLSERQALLAKLLHAISEVLGFKAEQLEIFEGGYTPQFWANIEADQEILRRYLVDIAQRKQFVPVGIVVTPNPMPDSSKVTPFPGPKQD